jgi:hypothetical protein
VSKPNPHQFLYNLTLFNPHPDLGGQKITAAVGIQLHPNTETKNLRQS